MSANAGTKPRKRAKPRTQRNEASRMAKALSHPLRATILVELSKRTASPVDLARELGQPLGNVSYHVRALRELDCIELATTRQRRGAIEHFYRATKRAELDADAWAEVPKPSRRAFALQWFRRSLADMSVAMDGDRFTEDDVHFSLTEIELDEAGWDEIGDQLRAVIDRALALQAESMSRETERRRGRLLLAQYEPASENPS